MVKLAVRCQRQPDNNSRQQDQNRLENNQRRQDENKQRQNRQGNSNGRSSLERSHSRNKRHVDREVTSSAFSGTTYRTSNTDTCSHTQAGDNLPPEWRAVHEPSVNRHYYWNKKTGETTWTKPKAVVVCAPDSGLVIHGAKQVPVKSQARLVQRQKAEQREVQREVSHCECHSRTLLFKYNAHNPSLHDVNSL